MGMAPGTSGCWRRFIALLPRKPKEMCPKYPNRFSHQRKYFSLSALQEQGTFGLGESRKPPGYWGHCRPIERNGRDGVKISLCACRQG